jgi:SAM-dependent methyltransferase
VAARVRARHRGGDRAYWDARYRESGAACLFGDRVAPLLRRAARLLPRRGRALDVACGEGQNAVWLAARGLAVTGLDVSPVAIARARARARRRGVRLRARVVDLTRHRLRRGWYDVVTCVHYLDRRLVPALAAALRPGGVVIVENATVRNLRLHARPGRRFTLRVGELAGWFPGLETLAYREGLMDGHEQAQLVARRPRAPRSPRAGRRADARRADARRADARRGGHRRADARRADARRADARRGGDGRGEGRVRPARRGPG